ncbi:MAG: DinB family protein [Ignavibacteriales bacterium]|nr:DinB family protein [Ignavibacteriales bacterium]
MYYKVSDFEKDWKFESDSTLKIFSTLTDESLAQSVLPEGRSIGRLAWHITTSVGEMMTRVGLNTDSPSEDTPVPGTAEEILSAYDKAAKSVLSEITKKWNDGSLLNEADMYGEMWQNGQTLKVLVNHQIHHRAQITVLMRQAGLKVLGIYGPSKEEWEAMGMPSMK